MNLLLAANTSAWSLLVLFVLISLFFSFLCSIGEAVLLSVTRPFIQHLVQEGHPAGLRLQALKQDIDRPLAAILTLNTIAHTVGATLAGTQAAVLFDGNLAMGVFSAIFTLVILVGSEIIPKTIGALHWKTLAPITARAVLALMVVLSPFVWLSNTITRRLGSGGHAHAFSREELHAMAEIASQEGHMDAQEMAMLRNLLLFRATTVGSIMTPRTVVFMLPAACTVAEFAEEHGAQPFSRIPVYGDTPDEVKGFVLRVQLLHAHALGQEERRLEEFLQPIRSVRVESTVMALFARMTGKRAHISLVIDEFGTMQGIVTLEDLVETLVGFEIIDETDKNVDMQAVARQLWEERAKRIGLKLDAPQVQVLPDAKTGPRTPTERSLPPGEDAV